MSKTPEALKSGDKVGIFCPASAIDKEIIVENAAILEDWGLQVELGESVGARYHKFAGDDELRIQDFQHFLDDPNIRAILCARGGYGCARIIDYISFENFVNDPIWIAGFSDITTIHNTLNQVYGVESLHAVMPSGYHNCRPEALVSLKAALFGQALSYQFERHELNKVGVGQGEVVGGNLSIVHSMLGSRSELNTQGKILFLEDVGERLYNIDRMMVSLKRAGLLSSLSGLVVGGFTDCTGEDFGFSAQEIIQQHCAPFDYPIAYNFPAGHQPDNRALIFNRMARLEVRPTQAKLSFAN